MSEILHPRLLAPLGEGCSCVEDHNPQAYVPEVHHVIPQSWGGPDVPENKRTICNNTHNATHRLLDEYVRRNRAGIDPKPPWSYQRHFTLLSRQMAEHAWEYRPVKPTFTLMHSWDPS